MKRIILGLVIIVLLFSCASTEYVQQTRIWQQKLWNPVKPAESRYHIPIDYKSLNGHPDFFFTYDKFDDATFIQHKENFHEDTKIGPFRIYISQTDTHKLLRAIFSYVGEDWLFFDRVTMINREGQRFSLSFKSYDKATEAVRGGNVIELIDLSIGNISEETGDTGLESIEELKAVLAGTGVQMRLQGQYSEVYEINFIQAQAFLSTINLFYEL